MFGPLTRRLATLPRLERPGVSILPPAEASLAATVAEGLYRQAMHDGGWALELGHLGPKLFLPEARECLRAIELGAAQAGPPTP